MSLRYRICYDEGTLIPVTQWGDRPIPDGNLEFYLASDYEALDRKRAAAQSAWDSLLLANDRQCQYIGDAQAILETLKDYQGTGYPGVRELLAKLPMDYTPTPHLIRDLREENLRLRDKLLECAKECVKCGGTGLWDYGERVEECPDCDDIRLVLGS